VIVVGDIGVGKTSLLRRMANFDPLSVVDAVPIDYLSKMAVVEKAPAPMKVQLWDTAGQEEFGAARLPSSYFRQAKAAIVVYDVTDRLSFAGVLRWATQIQAYQAHSSSSSSFALTLVGHKADVSNEARRVAASEGRELAKLIAASDFIECSSKDNTNVQTCFNAVAAALASGASWALSHTPLPSIDLISADLGQPSAPSCRHVACSALQLRAGAQSNAAGFVEQARIARPGRAVHRDAGCAPVDATGSPLARRRSCVELGGGCGGLVSPKIQGWMSADKCICSNAKE